MRRRPDQAVEYLDGAVRAAAYLHEQDPRDIHPFNLYFGALTRRATIALMLGDFPGAEQLLHTAYDLANSEVVSKVDHVQQNYLTQLSDLASDLERARSDH